MVEFGGSRQKKPALNACFGKPQNDMTEAARDVKLPMLRKGDRSKPVKACFSPGN